MIFLLRLLTFILFSCTAVFGITLASMDVALRHSTEWQLDKRYVQDNTVLDWYGIKTRPITAFQANNNWIAQIGDSLYFNEERWSTLPSNLLGAIAWSKGYAVLTENTLLLFNNNGELLQQLDHSFLPTHPTRLGLAGENPAIETSIGIWHTDNDATQWMAYEDVVAWSTPTTPPALLIKQLEQFDRGRQLTLLDVLRDFHSGKHFGPHGVVILDSAMGTIVFLALVSTLLIFRRKTKQ
ncbi:MAG: hypothetical protein H0W44_04550 [Gammaproteobacteria bacterium]|nr:hypothetical protein [Gammaproteobacteria bacterium]